MKPERRFRCTLRQLMIATALTALVCAGGLAWLRGRVEAQSRQAAQALHAAQLSAAKDRLAWAERMVYKGYLSNAQLHVERERLDVLNRQPLK